MNLQSIKAYPELIGRFNAEGHYYTSYPSLNHWREEFTEAEYRGRLKEFCEAGRALHLYIHIPFCAKLCHYCLCNLIVTNDEEKMRVFVDHLIKEIDLLREFPVNIREIHFGGGTPSHLPRVEFERLARALETLCDLASLEEVAMEIDPRTVKPGDLEFYAALGVDRISFGVQDFDRNVQKAINREQPAAMVESVLRDRNFFKGVNFDLLYGLPRQTHATIAETVRLTKRLSPERITLLKYCHVPELRRHMKLINAAELPAPEQLPLIFVDVTENLTESGYKWVGLDHFAKPGDSLAGESLHRTFNGFTPGRTRDMIGIGPSATGAFGDTYAQSIYDLPGYYGAIGAGRFPVLRGYRMSEDDVLRREVIFSLLCRQQADLGKYNGYFERERKLLHGVPELVLSRDGMIRLTKWGRVLLRSICKVFDVKDVAPEHYRIAQRSMTRKSA